MTAAINNFKFVALQDAHDLAPGMDGPGSAVVELQICPPVFQRQARLSASLVREREIVVGIGVSGCQPYGCAVSDDRIWNAAGLIQNIAQIEVREGVARIHFDGLAIVFLSGDKIVPVVVDRAQIDVGSGMCGFQFKHTQVGLDGFVVRADVLLQRDTAAEEVGSGLIISGRPNFFAGRRRPGRNDGPNGFKSSTN